MTSVFTDTDVILDFISGRQPFAIPAAGIFEAIHRGRIKAFTSSLSFSNLYYVLRKWHPPKKVISMLDSLTGYLSIVNVDEGIIKSALKSPFKDFEDAIQNLSAQSNKDISIIITRNIKDFKLSDLPVMTPETFLKTIQFSKEGSLES